MLYSSIIYTLFFNNVQKYEKYFELPTIFTTFAF